jgi:hypothetical protein
MKRLLRLMLNMGIVSLLILLAGCEGESLTDPIDSSLPEIKAIESEAAKVPAEGSTEVAVVANNGSSYSWTADGGTFLDASTNPTTWTAPDESGNFKLTCIVSNSSGSNSASITIGSVKLSIPEDATAYWPFETDFSDWIGDHDLTGDAVINTTNPRSGFGCVEFHADMAEILTTAGTDFDMGPSAEYSISWWMSTEHFRAAVIGKTLEGGNFIEPAKAFFFNPYEEFSWMNAFRGGVWGGFGAADGEWHHVAVTHNAADFYTIYVDAEERAAQTAPYDGTAEDTAELLFTIGGADEEGEGWPGPYEGLVDDVIFFPRVISAEEVAGLAGQ